MLLSNACFILLQDAITQMEICEAEEMLDVSVKEFEMLYGERNMSFSIYQLQHAAGCVSRWGPLWAYSAYPFENQNGKLLNLFNGSQAA